MTRFGITVGFIVVAAVAMLIYGMTKYARFSLDDASDWDMTQRYRLVCGAYPDVPIDETKIPVELQALLPLARRYGHGSRIMLEDCVAKMEKKEIEKTVALIDSHKDAIKGWIEINYRIETAPEVLSFRQLLVLREMLRPLISGTDTTV